VGLQPAELLVDEDTTHLRSGVTMSEKAPDNVSFRDVDQLADEMGRVLNGALDVLLAEQLGCDNGDPAKPGWPRTAMA
jgi:hypothetical protein